MKKPTIAVIGYGYVGKGAYNLFREHYSTKIYDPAFSGSNTKKEINECDLGVVCVPTPMDKDKSCDTSIVEETIKWLKTEVILIKSTVEPGTTYKLKDKYRKRIVFSPEYMGESKYWSPYNFDTNMSNCPFVILGGADEDTQYILDIMVPVLGPTKQYRQCTAMEAEVVKYMENTYFGVKITFANEMYNICQALGVNYYEVRDLWSLDPRVDRMHTAVFKNSRGFGGKCLPKDLNALVKLSEKAGYEPKFLKEMLKSNTRFKKLDNKI